MQDRPEASALLDAIADFLLKEVLPAVRESDALAYKTLVSWNMLGVVSRELKDAEPLLNAEIERLGRYLQKEVPLAATSREKMVLAAALNGELAAKIRSILPFISFWSCWKAASRSTKRTWVTWPMVWIFFCSFSRASGAISSSRKATT